MNKQYKLNLDTKIIFNITMKRIYNTLCNVCAVY